MYKIIKMLIDGIIGYFSIYFLNRLHMEGKDFYLSLLIVGIIFTVLFLINWFVFILINKKKENKK